MKVKNLTDKPFEFDENTKTEIVFYSIFMPLPFFILFICVIGSYNSYPGIPDNGKISFLWSLIPILLGILGGFFPFCVSLFNKIVYQLKRFKYKKEYGIIDWLNKCVCVEGDLLHLSIHDPYFTLLSHLYDMVDGSTNRKVVDKIRNIMKSISDAKLLEEEEKERSLLNKLECFDRVQENWLKHI